MYDPTRVYGYDIETHNEPHEQVCEEYAARGKDQCFGHGLDPRVSHITEIAVATDESVNGGGEVFAGPEEKILTDFRLFVRSLKPGLMVGWNSTFFDIPFISHRAALRGVDTGMRLSTQPGLKPKYDPLPTATTPENPHGAWSAIFEALGGGHAHLDVSQAYRRFADTTTDPATGKPVKWGLKPVCAALGIAMVEEDRENLHQISPERRKAYCLSDGTGTRELALRLLGLDYAPYR